MNNEWLATFFAAFAVSALGSLPLGTINLTTIQVAVKEGIRNALQFMMIAVIAEIIHVWMALGLEEYIFRHQAINRYFNYATIVFILILGLASLFYSHKKEATITDGSFTSVKAWAINILNPFSIPFWLFFITYLRTGGWIHPGFSKTMFCTGAAFGTLVTISFYAFLGQWLTSKNIFKRINIDRMVGVILLMMAFIKIIQLL